MDQVGAVLLLRADGAALLQHRDDKPDLRDAGMWVPPGGHADHGESIEACARRELREETDYDAADLHYLRSYECRAAGWPTYRLTIFWSRYDEKQPVVCREGQALAFVPRSEAADKTIPGHLLNAWDAALTAAKFETLRT